MCLAQGHKEAQTRSPSVLGQALYHCASRSVGPDLGLNCLQRLSADNKGKEFKKYDSL